MSATAIEYYTRKFGDNAQAAFVHLVREIGEIAFAIEKQNPEHAKLEITESVALLHFLASKYGLDVSQNMEALYSKKLASLK
jgi:NTP pyrophosphatase (non-canonical NTP hydrolase)